MTFQGEKTKPGSTRRTVLKAGGSLAAAALAAPMIGRAVAQETVEFRVATSEAIGSPLTEAFEAWTQRLREESDGRLDAQHFPASQLGSYTQLIEGNRIGTIQATTGGPDTEEAVAPEIAASGGAPGFIYRDDNHVDAVLQGELGDKISEIAREKTGVEFVAYGEVGFRHLLAKRPVETLEDLQGLKLRVPELKVWVDFWSKLGANPTPLPYAEQYSALSTGVIDGLEADVFSILGFKWYEQAKHLTLTNHWFLPKAVRVNAAFLDSLPEELQTLVRTSAKEVFAEQRANNRANADATLQELVSLGVEVHELKDVEKWREATASLFSEFGAKGPEVQTMIDDILAAAGA